MPKKEKKLRTLHPFMLKRIVDDADVDGGVRLIGTFVQIVYDLDKEKQDEIIDKQDAAFFGYRFNEISAKEGDVHVRRTERVKSEGEDAEGNKTTVLGTRTTIEVNLPLEIDSLKACFPFQIDLATVSIELSSMFCDKTKTTLRADILVHKEDSRQNISIQNKPKDETILEQFGQLEKHTDKIEEILDKMDKTKVYNLLSPYPEVFYEYDDSAKDYCPRFTLQFYLVKPGFYKLVSTLLPIILVWFVSVLNVWNDFAEEDGEETSNHLQVTSALTLTIVFVLPEVVNDDTNRDRLFTRENVNIIFFFFALVLASVPKRLAGTAYIELVGVVLMGMSLLLPVYHCMLFYIVQGKIHAKARRATENNRFLKDKTYKNEKNLGNFGKVGDLLKDIVKCDKKLYRKSKNKLRLWWNTEEVTEKNPEEGKKEEA